MRVGKRGGHVGEACRVGRVDGIKRFEVVIPVCFGAGALRPVDQLGS